MVPGLPDEKSSFTVSDGKLVLCLQSAEEGGYVVTSRLDPKLITGRRPSSFHEGGSHVLLGDGTVRFVNSTVKPEVWRALLTRDGSETVTDF